MTCQYKTVEKYQDLTWEYNSEDNELHEKIIFSGPDTEQQMFNKIVGKIPRKQPIKGGQIYLPENWRSQNTKHSLSGVKWYAMLLAVIDVTLSKQEIFQLLGERNQTRRRSFGIKIGAIQAAAVNAESYLFLILLVFFLLVDAGFLLKNNLVF